MHNNFIFYEKTKYLINTLGKNNKLLVITTMDAKYKDPYDKAVIASVTEDNFQIVVGNLAKTFKFQFIVIDDLYYIYDTTRKIGVMTDFLADISQKYKITIFT